MLYLYEMAFPRRDFGRAAATAWILFLIIVLIGVINYLISRTIASQDVRRTVRAPKTAVLESNGASR